jgi:hypothetical protein
VTVTTRYGTMGGSGAPTYTFHDPPALDHIPDCRGPLTGGTEVTLTGTALGGTTAVAFGAHPAATFDVLSDTEVRAVSPPGSAGEARITVSTPGGTAHAEAGCFMYLAPPVITSISPAEGPSGGGVNITITGTNLTSAGTTVWFGDVESPYWQGAWDNPNAMTAVVPESVPGQVHVRIEHAGGWSATSPATLFTYLDQPRPQVHALTPSSGHMTGGDTVVITGAHLAGATEVEFGTRTATFQVVSPTEIHAVAPPSNEGTAAVRVTTWRTSEAGPTYTYECATDEHEPNDGSYTQLGTVGIGTEKTVAGDLCAGDTDLFRFRAVETSEPVCLPGSPQHFRTTVTMTTHLPSRGTVLLSPSSGPATGADTTTRTVAHNWSGQCNQPDEQDFYLQLANYPGQTRSYTLTIHHARL